MNRRRDFLAFTASAAALGMVLPAKAMASTATEIDGELIACSAEYLAIEQRIEAIIDVAWAIQAADPEHYSEDHEQEADPLHERASVLRDRIVALPARTPDGLRAKSEFLLCYLSNGGTDPEPAASLACDVTGQVGWQSPFQWDTQS